MCGDMCRCCHVVLCGYAWLRCELLLCVVMLLCDYVAMHIDVRLCCDAWLRVLLL